MLWFRSRRLKRSYITRLRLADVRALADLHRLCFARVWGPSEFESLLCEPTSHVYGLKIGQNLIAFLLLRVAADEAEVLTLAVHPSWRGLACGERLMGYGFSQALSLGVRTCHLEVEAENRAAIRLYQKLGFAETGRRKRYYQQAEGGDALLMARALA